MARARVDRLVSEHFKTQPRSKQILLAHCFFDFEAHHRTVLALHPSILQTKISQFHQRMHKI
jgi:hypothetical protein